MLNDARPPSEQWRLFSLLVMSLSASGIAFPLCDMNSVFVFFRKVSLTVPTPFVSNPQFPITSDELSVFKVALWSAG